MPMRAPRYPLPRTSLVLALASILCTGAASAATITVTTTDDGSVTGECTLRDAVLSASDDTAHAACAAGDAGHDDIVFAPGVSGTILLTGGQLELVEETTITGPGADLLTIDAQQNSRIFLIDGDPSISTVLTGMTLTGGRTTADADSGGAISCQSALELVDSVVTGNSTAGANAPGGGIFTATTTVLTRTIVSGNHTEGYGSPAGGVMVVFGTGSLTDSTIADNWTEGDTAGGGGIVVLWNWFDATFVNSTVSGNSTLGDNSQAAGIAVGGNAFLYNSTVSGNSTYGVNNVGGFNDSGALSVTGNITLINSTLVDNVSMNGGFAVNLANPDTTVLTMKNTLLANTDGSTPLCDATIDAASGTHNLASDASCGSDTLIGGAPVTVAALALAPLADNGGPTMTHALLGGSAAIDAGDEATCDATPIGDLDQRGQTRPLDGNGDSNAICDVGAYEAEDTDTIFRDGFDP